jgi:NAD(P)-dependent dehydrogenase (short-subunit alcohol dehydrogenase family)
MPRQSDSLRSVVITGTSSGIGFECARRMAGRGWRVFACVRRPADAKRLEGLIGERPVVIVLDVTDREGPAALHAMLRETTGSTGLHGLVNNAGVVAAGPFETVTMESWRNIMEVNVLGTVALTQALLPLLRAGRGRIVNVSSIAGRVATPYLAPYCASKHALEAVSDSLRRELVADGIAVSIIEPGVVDTPIWEKGLEELNVTLDSLDPLMRERYATIIASMRDRLAATRRHGVPPEEVASCVEHALTARRPRARYPVGTRVRLKILLERMLPSWVSDRLSRRHAPPGRVTKR